jgi:hypothetical protein
LQARKEEARIAEARSASSLATSSSSREQDLWRLNSGLVGELRNYLLDSPIFPRFKVTERAVSDGEYYSIFEFEADPSKQFVVSWLFGIKLMISPVATAATDLKLEVECGGKRVAEASWTEMFKVQSAFSNCQRVLLDAAVTLLA